MTANLATKQDILATADDIKAFRFEMAEMRTQLRVEIRESAEQLRIEMRETAEQLRTEIRETAEQLRTEFRTELNFRLKLLENRMTIRLGVMMMSGLTILVALMKILHL